MEQKQILSRLLHSYSKQIQKEFMSILNNRCLTPQQVSIISISCQLSYEELTDNFKKMFEDNSQLMLDKLNESNQTLNEQV